MRKIISAILIVSSFLLVALGTHAQSTSFISIPASAFSGANGSRSMNETGTAMFFSTYAFAPVNLPNRSKIISFACGARSFFQKSIVFSLRRNEPQQKNVDIATLSTSLTNTNFEFLNTTTITEGVVNNSRFNYYIIADMFKPGEGPGNEAFCKKGECWVGFCKIGYSIPNLSKPVFSK
jgi:hypothetical protein